MRPEDSQSLAQTTTDQADLPEGAASPPVREFSIQYVRDVLTEKIIPEPMVVPPEVEECVKREPLLRNKKPPRWLIELWCLMFYYGGNIIATFKTKAGHKVVVAAGEVEIKALLQDVPYEENRHVCIEFPEPWR